MDRIKKPDFFYLFYSYPFHLRAQLKDSLLKRVNTPYEVWLLTEAAEETM